MSDWLMAAATRVTQRLKLTHRPLLVWDILQAAVSFSISPDLKGTLILTHLYAFNADKLRAESNRA